MRDDYLSLDRAPAAGLLAPRREMSGHFGLRVLLGWIWGFCVLLGVESWVTAPQHVSAVSISAIGRLFAIHLPQIL